MRLILRAAGAVALCLVVASCADASRGSESTAPTQSFAHVGIAPEFSPAAVQAYGALTASGGDITSVRIVLLNLAGAVALDTVIAFPATAETLTIELPVAIEGKEQDFNATIQLRDASGTVQFASTRLVTAHEQSTHVGAPFVLTLDYVGPGATAKTIAVAPNGGDLNAGSTQAVSASALDATGKSLTDLSVTWKVSDATIATITPTGTATALVTSTGKRGTLTVTATTQAGIAGSAILNVKPVPSRLVVISGGNQTGQAFQTVANPFIVELQGTDGSGVAFKVVSFRVVGTDGDVTTPIATTDANGRASTTMKLGRSAGIYSYEASSGTLTPVSITETATAATIGVPTQLIPLAPVPQSFKVGQSSTQLYSAQIADANGQYVLQAGIVITATFVVQPGGATTSVSATSNAAGVVQFGVIPPFQSAGSVTITLTSSVATMVSLPFGTFTITP